MQDKRGSGERIEKAQNVELPGGAVDADPLSGDARVSKMLHGSGRGRDGSALVERARSGDPTAFESVYEAVARFALPYLTALLADAHEAEDVFHEVMIAILDGERTYEPQRGPIERWVRGIARNKAVERLRRPSARLAGPIDLVATVEGFAAIDDADRGDEFGLPSLVKVLPLAQRKVLFLRFTLGYSASEIASLQGCSAGAVREMQRYALGTLRGRLGVRNGKPRRDGDLLGDREIAMTRGPGAAERHPMVPLARPSPVLMARRAFAF